MIIHLHLFEQEAECAAIIVFNGIEEYHISCRIGVNAAEFITIPQW